MPVLSQLARRKKLDYFFADVTPETRILEVGCADRWLGRQLRTQGLLNNTGLDVMPGADVVGDIRNWPQLGLKPESFDLIVAFELIEHIDCFSEVFALLRPGGRMFLTSPVPHMDWACKLLERIGLNQKRTSPHSHLRDFNSIPFFEVIEIRKVGYMAQWGKFRKPAA